MKFKHAFLPALIAAAFASGCGSDDGGSVVSEAPSMTELSVPSGFSYQSVREVPLNVSVFYPTGAPAAGVPVIVTTALADEEVPTDETTLLRGLTDGSGSLDENLVIPTAEDQVTITASVIGVSNRVTVDVTPAGISHSFAR